MHKFVRTAAPQAELAPLTSGKVSTWGEYMKRYPDEHNKLSRLLWVMQDFFCAYCERVVDFRDGECYGDGHIEHLERIRDNPGRKGDWTNMYFSCNDVCSCGRYKDAMAGRIDYGKVIDPSTEDPLEYLVYDPNGGVSPRPGDVGKIAKATETIRIFNLDQAPSLRALRKQIAITVEGFLETSPDVNEVAVFLDDVASSDCPSVYRSLLGYGRV